MDKKEYNENIKEIKHILKCSDDIAHKALSRTNNFNRALVLAKDLMDDEVYVGGSTSGLAVENTKKIVEYSDGILVQDMFHSYKDKKNLELKTMLERKEFDARLLGGKDNDHVSVVYVDKKHETYEKVEKPKIVYPQVGESLDLPETIVIEEGDIKFKILTSDKRINVTMKEGTIGDVIKWIEKKCGKRVALKSGNQVLENELNVENVNRSMLLLEVHK